MKNVHIEFTIRLLIIGLILLAGLSMCAQRNTSPSEITTTSRSHITNPTTYFLDPSSVTIPYEEIRDARYIRKRSEESLQNLFDEAGYVWDNNTGLTSKETPTKETQTVTNKESDKPMQENPTPTLQESVENVQVVPDQDVQFQVVLP
ncbi:MAG: hypothetical protein HRT61_01475, partial [Ekhidna sp.]|nr:hypothetical protein [Ekhidna sp.]